MCQETAALCGLLGVVAWAPGDPVLASNLCQVEAECADTGGEVTLRLATRAAPLHHLVLAGPTKQLAEQYSQAVLDTVRVAALVARDTCRGDTGAGDTCRGDTGAGDTCRGDTGAGDTCRGDKGGGKEGEGNPVLEVLQRCLHQGGLQYECPSVERAVRGCVLGAVHSLARVEMVCYTRTRLAAVTRPGARLGQARDTDDEEEESEEEE